MYIGELCKHTQTTPKAIRYYESIGLLPPAKRRGSYRVYDESYVATVRLIKLAQQYGFTLAELKHVIADGDIHAGVTQQQILQAVKLKRQAISRQIDELQVINTHLVDFEAGLKQTPCCVDSIPKGKV